MLFKNGNNNNNNKKQKNLDNQEILKEQQKLLINKHKNVLDKENRNLSLKKYKKL